MYKKLLQNNLDGLTIEYIILDRGNNEFTSFTNVESNDGPERQAYLAWVAEGNVAEEWNPNGN
jgi:hypothetical protein